MHVFSANLDDVHTADERRKLEGFVDTYRRLTNESLGDVTEEEPTAVSCRRGRPCSGSSST